MRSSYVALEVVVICVSVFLDGRLCWHSYSFVRILWWLIKFYSHTQKKKKCKDTLTVMPLILFTCSSQIFYFSLWLGDANKGTRSYFAGKVYTSVNVKHEISRKCQFQRLIGLSFPPPSFFFSASMLLWICLRSKSFVIYYVKHLIFGISSSFRF